MVSRVTDKNRNLFSVPWENQDLTDTTREDEKIIIRKWLKRTFYVALIIIVFVSIPSIVDMLVTWATGGEWRDVFMRGWFGDRESAQIFLLGFGVILGLFVIIIYFMLNIFSGEEGGW